MTLTVRTFAASDMLAMVVQAGQKEVAALADRQRAADVAMAAGRAFTVRDKHGGILLCGGAIENHPGHASLWATLSPAAGAHMTALTRRVGQFVSMLDHARIDAYVRADFGPACRWLDLLGFRMEAGPLRRFWRDGADALLYARCREAR